MGEGSHPAFRTPQTTNNTPKRAGHLTSPQGYTIEEVENLNFKKISNKKGHLGYDYNQPGSLTMAYRVPDNLVGGDLRNATKYTANVNQELMVDQASRKTKSDWTKSNAY